MRFYAKWRASVEIFRRRKNTCRYYNNRYKDADYGWNGINRNLNERFPDIKVIILTAYSDFTYAQQAIKFQVSDFVVKNDFFLELPRAVKK